MEIGSSVSPFAESRLRWQLSDDIVTDICSDHPVRIEPDLRPCPLGSNSNDGVDHMLRPYCLGHPILTVHPVEKAEYPASDSAPAHLWLSTASL